MKAHPGAIEDCHGAQKAHHGAMEACPGAMESLSNIGLKLNSNIHILR